MVVAGVATRALALSAVRAGFDVLAVDAFGDVDLCASAAVIALRREPGERYSAMGAARSAAREDAWGAAYTSNFENYPDAVALLAAGRVLLGNGPSVLERVRHPLTLMRALRGRGFAVPLTRASAPPPGASGRWLSKPRRSGGGHGTKSWRSGSVPRGAYVQSRIEGSPGSITFLANGKEAVPIGISRQLVGEAAFGARGFRYCGSLLLGSGRPIFEREAELVWKAHALADAVTAEFGLVGLNGVDFIASDGVPYPIEVNPRYSASMELVEKASGVSLFDLHVRACHGELSAVPSPGRNVTGKAIVFARRGVRVGDTSGWSSRGVADVPHEGEVIGRGHPICTVFAEGRNAVDCRGRLLKKAEAIFRLVEHTRGAA